MRQVNEGVARVRPRTGLCVAIDGHGVSDRRELRYLDHVHAGAGNTEDNPISVLCGVRARDWLPRGAGARCQRC